MLQCTVRRRSIGRISLLPEAEVTGAHAIDLLLDAELTQGTLSIRDAGLTETRGVFELVAAGVGEAIANTTGTGVA